MILVDTNILVDVLEDDLDWADWSIGQMRSQSQVHKLIINPVIYAELSLIFSTIEALEKTVLGMQLESVEVPRPALFLAGKAFAQYRRRQGTKSKVLGDFYIGAHAAVAGCAILTRDAQRYRSYFPSVPVITP